MCLHKHLPFLEFLTEVGSKTQKMSKQNEWNGVLILDCKMYCLLACQMFSRTCHWLTFPIFFPDLKTPARRRGMEMCSWWMDEGDDSARWWVLLPAAAARRLRMSNTLVSSFVGSLTHSRRSYLKIKSNESTWICIQWRPTPSRRRRRTRRAVDILVVANKQRRGPVPDEWTELGAQHSFRNCTLYSARR